jgi:hypothetical protein
MRETLLHAGKEVEQAIAARSRPSRWWKLGGGRCASSGCDFWQ